MGCPLLYGSHELLVDEKNRLFIPASIRRSLNPEAHGAAFFVKLGLNGTLWMYPERYYEELAGREPSGLSPTEDELDYDQFNFALADRLEWDKQGRVVLPDGMLKDAGINKEVVLAGARDHLELWDREAWKRHKDALLARRSEIALRQRQLRQSQGV